MRKHDEKKRGTHKRGTKEEQRRKKRKQKALGRTKKIEKQEKETQGGTREETRG